MANLFRCGGSNEKLPNPLTITVSNSITTSSSTWNANYSGYNYNKIDLTPFWNMGYTKLSCNNKNYTPSTATLTLSVSASGSNVTGGSAQASNSSSSTLVFSK